MATSCVKKKEAADDILLRFGDNVLTKEAVISEIPQGLLAADSLALFNSIIDAWVNDMVIADFAKDRLSDLSAIERRVKDYRNSLIVLEYLSRMKESYSPKIEESSIKEYYEIHQQELKLEEPLIKGIFLKVNSQNSGNNDIKKLLSSSDPNAIDKLEQEWIDKALEYNYFRDKWIDWTTITTLIPYRFGDPDNFLSSNKYFETEYEDCAYYLQISEYLPSGEIQPFEFASSWIADLLTQRELADYEKELVNELVAKSIKDKKLELIGYDPISNQFIENNNNKDEKE